MVLLLTLLLAHGAPGRATGTVARPLAAAA